MAPSFLPPPLKLSVYAFLHSETLTHSLPILLREPSRAPGKDTRFSITVFSRQNEFLLAVEQAQPTVDCIILEEDEVLAEVLKYLQRQSLLVPAIILGENPACIPSPEQAGHEQSVLSCYHAALLQVPKTQIGQIKHYIDEAIAKFLTLSANEPLEDEESVPRALIALTAHRSLMQQQQRLAEKLTERLGYLGVYYKRNPAHFLRNMTLHERQELLDQLKVDYRKIILSYFSNEPLLNEQIDNFVNLAFFADVPVTQIVEIHMNLMDEFSKHLKMEGRSDEILLDYRLTLIDTLAHLCEMYRRSIPRET